MKTLLASLLPSPDIGPNTSTFIDGPEITYNKALERGIRLILSGMSFEPALKSVPMDRRYDLRKDLMEYAEAIQIMRN